MGIDPPVIELLPVGITSHIEFAIGGFNARVQRRLIAVEVNRQGASVDFHRRNVTAHLHIADTKTAIDLRMQHRAAESHIGFNVGFHFAVFANQRREKIDVERSELKRALHLLVFSDDIRNRQLAADIAVVRHIHLPIGLQAVFHQHRVELNLVPAEFECLFQFLFHIAFRHANFCLHLRRLIR